MDNMPEQGMGTGEVHSHLGLGPSEDASGSFRSAPMGGAETTGGTQDQAGGGTDSRAGVTGAVEQAKQQATEVADQVRDRAQDIAGQAQDRLEGIRDRAGEVMSQAKDRAGQMLSQAESTIEKSGAVDKARENPLAALGIAFAIGFLLAGKSDSRSTFGKAKRQVRGAIMTGVTAAVAQEARNFLGVQGGASGLFGGLFGDQGEQDSGHRAAGSARA